jgi:hypothetical protein
MHKKKTNKITLITSLYLLSYKRCLKWHHVWSQQLIERKFGTLQLWHFSLNLITASVAFLLHTPSTKCMCANSVNEEPLSVLDSYLTCSRKLTLLQTELHLVGFVYITELYIPSRINRQCKYQHKVQHHHMIQTKFSWKVRFSERDSRSWHFLLVITI